MTHFGDRAAETSFEAVESIVSRRKTAKVFAPSAPVQFDSQIAVQCDAIVQRSIAAAGMAPFHLPRGMDGLPEPWRIHWLRSAACRKLAAAMPDLVDVPPKNRQRELLNGCGSLILVNWLPETGLADETKQRQVNEEHLAAAAALTQSLLILLEAAGLETYWASPGLLNAGPVRRSLLLPETESTIAAVFVGYPRPAGVECELAAGKNRVARTSPSHWTREH